MTRFLCCAVISLLAMKSQGQENVITGIRTWRLADGTAKRLQLVYVPENASAAYFSASPGKKNLPVPMARFSPEDQSVLREVASKKTRLCLAHEIPMRLDFPVGPAKLSASDFYLGGDLREWKHADGKSILARVVNLTDEDVSLLAQRSISRVALSDLSPEDIAYLERLKRKKESVLQIGDVQVEAGGWEGGPSHYVLIDYEEFVDFAKLPAGFEIALETALETAEKAFPPDTWKLAEFTETSSHTKKLRRTMFVYTAEFSLKPKSYQIAKRKWPASTTPTSWPGEKCVILYLAADGTLLSAIIGS
ncbi:MAG: hypothetical protein V4733_10725 [Verrucomicrobiota bacterium]